jgi:MraZ protein
MEYLGTLDEKCRICLPSRVRGNLKVTHLILTKGVNRSIWMFTPEGWDRFSAKLANDSVALSLNKQLLIQHQFIAPKAEMEIDRAGRIAIPQSLRDFACLSKEITILEVVNHLEMWDSGQYAEYLKANETQLYEVLEEMGPVTLFSRNPG